MRIGFIRSLHYYSLSPFWETFFDALGHEPVCVEIAHDTLPDRLAEYENELCLPVKVFLAGAARLVDLEVDYIFSPLVWSLKHKVFSCPKFIMAPELIGLYCPQVLSSSPPRLLLPGFYAQYEAVDRMSEWSELCLLIGDKLGCGRRLVENAVGTARVAQREHDSAVREGGRFHDELLAFGSRPRRGPFRGEGPRILLLGHRYSVHGSALNHQLVARLRRLGVRPIAKEHLLRGEQSSNVMAEIGVDVDIHYSEGAEILRAAHIAARDPAIRGVAYVTMFNCGFDAVLEDIVSRRILKGISKPYLNLVIDEHSSNTNMATRLEVFTDIVHDEAGFNDG
jgi:predicted nucleotide-binding protein (sugar kinase/HSP70/actin superfamily)